MNIKCLLLLACLSVISVPSESLPTRRVRNLMKRVVRPLKPSPALPNLPRPVLSSPPLLRSRIPTSPRSTPVSAAAIPTTPTPSEHKVAAFAKKLRDDMEKQERRLNVFITTIKQKHQQSTLKLSRIKVILKELKEQIANATQYANRYESEVNTQSGQDKIIEDEYEKSHKMYNDELATIEFEKKFLEEIIKYIQMRRSNCLTK